MLILVKLPLRWVDGRRKLFLWDLPLHGAAGLEKGSCGFWGAPAAHERKMMLLGEFMHILRVP